jgi:hypothetical protein
MTTSPPTHRSVPQGHRPSVEPTTERRRPSARRRPGAGLLPPWRPAARVPDEFDGLRRSDKHFRIYSEEEFFAREDLGVSIAPPGIALCAPTETPGGGARRAICAVALIGATGAVGSVIALHVIASFVHPRRRGLPRTAHAEVGRFGARAYASSGSAGRRPRPRRFARAKRSSPSVHARLRGGSRRSNSGPSAAAPAQPVAPRPSSATPRLGASGNAATQRVDETPTETAEVPSTTAYPRQLEPIAQDRADRTPQQHQGEFGFER